MGRNPDIEFPVKPEREPFNYTAHMGQDDHNDVYTGRYGWTMGRNDMEYELQIEAYSTLSYRSSDVGADKKTRLSRINHST
jgi:hypothetical protein